MVMTCIQPWCRGVLICTASKFLRNNYAWIPSTDCMDYRAEWCRMGSMPSHQRRSYGAVVQNYYDILGITPKSSHAQIKAAYYRLSKKYHPDVNKESGAQTKFTEISEAYEILNDRSKRRLYDRGMFSHGSTYSGSVDVEYQEFMRKQGHFSKRGSAPTGKTKIYDFDEFYRQHYGEAIKMKQESDLRQKEFHRTMEELETQRRGRIVAYFALIGLMFVVPVISSMKT